MGTFDRQPYLTATSLTQAFLDECSDNLTNQLELIVDIETPTGILHYSDRNKYVGETFYEARLVFPIINRTIGEYLNPTLEFSQLQIELNNADSALNDIIPSGSNYQPWAGNYVSVKLGLRDIESTYTEIFYGKLIEEGGFQRTTKSIILMYRNEFSHLNQNFPKAVFKRTTFPDIESENENLLAPVIYGDWTINVDPNGASVPAICVNGANEDVNGEVSNTVAAQFIIADHALTSFDTSAVYLFKNDTFYLFDSSDIQNVTDNRYFELRQKDTSPAGVTLIDGEPYAYQEGDKLFVKVVGKDLGAYTSNVVSQSMDILTTYLNVDPGFFDTSWTHFKNKSSPSGSDIYNIKSRIWLGEPQEGFTYVLSLLEQVRLEAFINRTGKLSLSSLHWDEFEANPSFTIKNWDIEKDSFTPKTSETLNFNRCRGSYNFLPNRNEDFNETPTFKNQASIDAIEKEISKKIVFPNLYVASEVEFQLKEILKITSSYMEIISLNLTWRSILQDIGNFVKLNVEIQGTKFENVPCLIRDIGYDPQGMKIICNLWSFQMMPFTGWTPTYSGIVGGDTAIITSE